MKTVTLTLYRPFVDDLNVGWLCFPEYIPAYRYAHDDEASSYIDVTSGDVYKVISKAFESPDYINRLWDFLSLEDVKGFSDFRNYVASLFKYLFKVFEGKNSELALEQNQGVLQGCSRQVETATSY